MKHGDIPGRHASDWQPRLALTGAGRRQGAIKFLFLRIDRTGWRPTLPHIWNAFRRPGRSSGRAGRQLARILRRAQHTGTSIFESKIWHPASAAAPSRTHADLCGRRPFRCPVAIQEPTSPATVSPLTVGTCTPGRQEGMHFVEQACYLPFTPSAKHTTYVILHTS